MLKLLPWDLRGTLATKECYRARKKGYRVFARAIQLMKNFTVIFFSRSRFEQLPVGMTSILAGLGQSLLDQPPNIQNLDPKK